MTPHQTRRSSSTSTQEPISGIRTISTQQDATGVMFQKCERRTQRCLDMRLSADLILETFVAPLVGDESQERALVWHRVRQIDTPQDIHRFQPPSKR
ncbi:hypothetical protein DPV78_006028 [Talaromyces pinophilus]|nr:hypothetical protein DPV78_006028 [Talaromyces pinophilus]